MNEPLAVAQARRRATYGQASAAEMELIAWADHFTYLADWEPKYGFDRPPMHPVVVKGSFRAYGHTIGPAQRQLESWVKGVPLTPGLEPDPGDHTAGLLRIEGKLDGSMRWTVQFRQHGHLDRSGFCTGSSAEDACAEAVEAIREEEAEWLLLAAVPGTA